MLRSIDVLVVEDRILDADAMLFALEHVAPHASVLHLRSGDEALQFLFSVGMFSDRGGRMPHLVLLSVEMPVTSGLFVLDIMRAHPLTYDIPVIALSREKQARTPQRFSNFDADAYVQKEWDLERACAFVDWATQRWLPSSQERVPSGIPLGPHRTRMHRAPAYR